MDRRAFIFKSGTMGLALAMGASSCAPGSSLYRGNAGNNFDSRHLPRVRLSPDRIIKETVGLRTYRLSGPRLVTTIQTIAKENAGTSSCFSIK